MNPQKSSAKDFIINLGAIVALYTLVYSLVNLLFTVIDKAFPPITSGYSYYSSTSISWPVATLVIFFPIFILLMWLLEREYVLEPERQNYGIHKWLTYITLFIAGLTIAGDLITVLYYFIDGQNLTTGFLLKVVVLLIIASGVFTYYISDVRGKLNKNSRNIWRIVSAVIIIGSIIWGFSVLGSPATQRLYKYDEQKVNDLTNIDSQVINFYVPRGTLPETLADLTNPSNYFVPPVDPQTQKPYEYKAGIFPTYTLCAEFNKPSNNNNQMMQPVSYPYKGTSSWAHPAGHYCFTETIDQSIGPKNDVPVINGG